MFQGLLVERDHGGPQTVQVQPLSERQLPAGELLLEVQHSSLNYKDALAVTGQAPIICSYPMIPGIDLAGTVLESSVDEWRPGDSLVATGWGLGESHWGGFAQRARLPADWALPIPKGLDSHRAMVLGTAGLAAMLCITELEGAGVLPDSGPILVTGASGGVGGIAIALLNRLGYAVVAATGKTDAERELRALGAIEVVQRADLNIPARPLERQQWAGAVDTVGGSVLARVLAGIYKHGAVVTCGLSGGADLSTNVMPFILRAIRLIGIETVACATPVRERAWQRLTDLLDSEFFASLGHTIGLREVPQAAAELLAGQRRGRTVIALMD